MSAARLWTRLSRLVVGVAVATGITGLLAMHGVAPAHDSMALGRLTASPMSHGTSESSDVAAGSPTSFAEWPGSLARTKALQAVKAGALADPGLRRAGRPVLNMAMGLSHGAMGACIAVLAAAVAMSLFRRLSRPIPALLAAWLQVRRSVLAAPDVRRRSPALWELCVLRT